jgi:hypothetical protein
METQLVVTNKGAHNSLQFILCKIIVNKEYCL